MELIVADANIFVYLFRCDLLIKFIISDHHEIIITKAVYDELTSRDRRITREHHELREILNCAIYDDSSIEKISVININELEMQTESMGIYFKLEEQGELDCGEIESISLALDMRRRFLSNDEEAIQEANSISYGMGIMFTDFCREIASKGVINDADLQKILRFMEE